MPVQIPPFYDVLIDEEKKTSLNWTIFFQNIANGDSGTSWNPTFVNLTASGTPVYTGRYFNISKNLAYFYIIINPSGGNTTSVAATTYCDNFPQNIATDGVCFVSTGSGAVQAIGGVRASDKRIYTPAWSAVTETLTIVGLINLV